MKVSEFWDYYRGDDEVLRIYWEPPEIVDDCPMTGVKIRRLETIIMTESDWDNRLGHLLQRFRGSSAARIVAVQTES